MSKTEEQDEARLARLDYYTLLGIEKDASTEQIREAFHKFARRYHPDVYAGQVEEKVERASFIYRRGSEAYRVLLNEKQRAEYDQGLVLGEKRYSHNPAATRRKAAESIPPEARQAAKSAQLAMKLGNYASAKRKILEALSHDPGNAVLLSALAEIEEELDE